MVIWTPQALYPTNTEHPRSKTSHTWWPWLPPFNWFDRLMQKKKTYTCTTCHHTSLITQNLKLVTLRWKEPINCCKTNFTKLFKQPWQSMTVALIKTGSRKCGIFPLDRSAIDASQLSDNSLNSPPTSSNLPNPNQPSYTYKNTSLIAGTSQEVSNSCTSTPEHSSYQTHWYYMVLYQQAL